MPRWQYSLGLRTLAILFAVAVAATALAYGVLHFASPDGADIRLAVLLLALAAMAQIAATWLILDRLVLRPVARLTRRLSADRPDIADARPPRHRARRDEIGRLADSQDRWTASLSGQVQELNRVVARLHAADATKSTFFANMSHELRTPLNAIIGFSDLLANQPFGPIPDRRYLDYIDDIHTSGHHLLDLVNQILDFSKADRQQLQVVPEQVSLYDVIEDSMRMLRLQASQAGIVLERDLEPGLPPLFSDKLRLSQILLNLLSNAVKFTDAGGRVTVRARRRDDRIEIQVTDTGIGIAAEDIPRALAPFVQLPQRNRSIPGGTGTGTGLGLPLAKRLTELLEGRFDLISEEGAGTTAQATLPLALSQAALDAIPEDQLRSVS